MLCKKIHYCVPIVPIMYRKSIDDVCNYYCYCENKGVSKKQKDAIQYASFSSALRPVPHSHELPIPITPGQLFPVICHKKVEHNNCDSIFYLLPN